MAEPGKSLITEGMGDTPMRYLVHTEYPRFTAEIGEVIFPDGREYTFKICKRIDSIDENDAGLVVRICREAGELLQQYDRHAERVSAEHGDSSWRL